MAYNSDLHCAASPFVSLCMQICVCVCIWRTLLRFIRFDIAGIYVLILCCLAIRCHLSPNIWLPFSPGTCWKLLSPARPLPRTPLSAVAPASRPDHRRSASTMSLGSCAKVFAHLCDRIEFLDWRGVSGAGRSGSGWKSELAKEAEAEETEVETGLVAQPSGFKIK